MCQPCVPLPDFHSRSIGSMSLVQKRISELGSAQNGGSSKPPTVAKKPSFKNAAASSRPMQNGTASSIGRPPPKSNIFAPKPFKPFNSNDNGVPKKVVSSSFVMNIADRVESEAEKTPDVPPR